MRRCLARGVEIALKSDLMVVRDSILTEVTFYTGIYGAIILTAGNMPDFVQAVYRSISFLANRVRMYSCHNLLQQHQFWSWFGDVERVC